MSQLYPELLNLLVIPRTLFSAAPLTSALGLFIAVSIWQWLRYKSKCEALGPIDACRGFGESIEARHIANQVRCDSHDVHTNGKTSKWRVKNLWIYPVKSCRGIDLPEATVSGIGLQYDRQFSFARYQKSSKPNEPDVFKWTFITQRSIPKMATIRTEVWVPDPAAPLYSPNHPHVQSSGVLRIIFPDEKTGKDRHMDVPFEPTETYINSEALKTADMTIWKDNPNALIMASTERSHPWMNELQSYLQITTPIALFRTTDPNARRLYRCAPRIEELGYQPSVCFQDAYPLHILNVASVRDIARRFEGGEQTLSAANFRPNIVIEGGDAYAEDSWKYIKIGPAEYYVSCRTVRCLLPNVNPITGTRRDEPNKTLKKYRKIDEGDPTNACLGMQLVPATSDKRKIQVGDEITVSATGEHRYIKQ